MVSYNGLASLSKVSYALCFLLRYAPHPCPQLLKQKWMDGWNYINNHKKNDKK